MARLIVPTDYSTTAEKAIDQAFLIAQKNNDEVELLNVVIVPPSSESPKIWDYIMGEKKVEEQRLRDLATARIKALGLPASTRWRVRVLYSERFLDGILSRFEKSKAKLVVMGTTGVSGLANKIFGSNTANLISKGAVPVLAIPPNWTPQPLKAIEFCITPEQVPAHKRDLKKWATWLGAEGSITYFTNVAGAGVAQKDSPFPIKTVITIPEDALYEDLVEYSKDLKSTVLAMLVHERMTMFERIFDKSITGQVAGRVLIPMLAVPVKAD